MKEKLTLVFVWMYILYVIPGFFIFMAFNMGIGIERGMINIMFYLIGAAIIYAPAGLLMEIS